MKQFPLSKRGAYFFVLDAFIAGLVIVATLAITISSSSIQEDPLQASLLVEDFMSYLEQTTLAEYSGEMVYALQDAGLIHDTSHTLLEGIVLLHAQGPSAQENLSALLQELSRLAPEQIGIGYYIDSQEEALYEQTVANKPQDAARLLLSAKRIVLVRGSDLELAVVEVRGWQ